jgi:hypothetical protein
MEPTMPTGCRVGDAGEAAIPRHHVKELAGFFAADDQWLFGHACVRTQGDRELAADSVQDTFRATGIRSRPTPPGGSARPSPAPWAGRSRPRIPERTAAAIAEILIAQRRLARELGREPTPEELAAELSPDPD